MGKNEPRILTSNIVYKHDYMQVIEDVVEFESGAKQTWAYTDAGDGVAILPYDKKSGEVWLIETYKHAIGDSLLSVAAGGIEGDEESLPAAKRELEEELGLVARKWDILGEFYPSPGTYKQKAVMYLATDLTSVGVEREEGEYMRTVKMPLSQAVELVHSNKIQAGWAVTTILMAEYFISQ